MADYSYNRPPFGWTITTEIDHRPPEGWIIMTEIDRPPTTRRVDDYKFIWTFTPPGWTFINLFGRLPPPGETIINLFGRLRDACILI